MPQTRFSEPGFWIDVVFDFEVVLESCLESILQYSHESIPTNPFRPTCSAPNYSTAILSDASPVSAPQDSRACNSVSLSLSRSCTHEVMKPRLPERACPCSAFLKLEFHLSSHASLFAFAHLPGYERAAKRLGTAENLGAAYFGFKRAGFDIPVRSK